MNGPKYLDLLKNGELGNRVKKLNKMLEHCNLCPHKCGVNRLDGQTGYCNTLDNCIISGAQPHFGEEDEMVGTNGSGTIFFSHCNIRCVFCQNYEISQCGEGQEITPSELSNIMLYLQNLGCHNVNLVSPGHIIPQIVEAIFMAAKKGLNIPIVYNTNGYDLTESLKLLDGIIDIYMPDLKFSNDEIALKYLRVKNYYSIAKEAIKEMYKQVGDLDTNENNIAYKGLLIRHLVLPGNLAGTKKIMSFIANEISKDTYINIMAQYYPAYKSYEYKELSRGISKREYEIAVNTAKSCGLTRYKSSI